MSFKHNGASAVFLQARLGSQRLPHKILLDLDGRTVLEQAMHRLSLVKTDYHVVLTDKYSYDILNRITSRFSDWECFMGPAQDVLARYVFAARHYAVGTIIRATADNPLVSHELANLMLNSREGARADYYALDGMPYGAGVELVRTSALEKAFVESMSPYDHEHVCPFIYNNPKKFHVLKEDAPLEYRHAGLRITLDTEEDYRFLKALFRNYQLNSRPGLSSLLKTLYSVAV